MADLAQIIRDIRKNAKLTQQEFANAIGATQGSVSKWEAGREKPRFEFIEAIEKFAGSDDLYRIATLKEHDNWARTGVRAVPVVGSIHHGYEREKDRWSDEDWFLMNVPLSNLFPQVLLQGWMVRGSTFYPQYPQNSYLVAANWPGGWKIEGGRLTGETALYGDEAFIVSIRTKSGGVVVTIRDLQIDATGEMILKAPAYSSERKRINVPVTLASEGGPVSILGMVIYAYVPVIDPARVVSDAQENHPELQISNEELAAELDPRPYGHHTD